MTDEENHYFNDPSLPFPQEDIPRLLSALDADERRMVELRWGLTSDRPGRRATVSTSFAEIGREFGITRVPVRRHLNDAVAKMVAAACQEDVVAKMVAMACQEDGPE